ncbi:uncharacterized protein [Choristoneura fumiferana]|uniref:uncharacterized protein n=1 Tax=Choristoneura fumiferana TaxID=7141 RepID=UPI003D15F15D
MNDTQTTGSSPPPPIPNQASEHENIEVISIKSRIPPFWRDQPRLWFAQFETVVANQKLNDESKFSLIVTQFEKADVEQISDIILAQPNTGRYEATKTRLLTVYEECGADQLHKLLHEMELGDQRPSQLLRRMRGPARGRIPDETLRMLWMGHLPAAIRTVLAVHEETDLDALAALADKMHEQSRQIHAVSSRPGPAVPSTSQITPSTENSNLIDMIEALRVEVAAMRMDRSRYRQQRPYKRRSRSRSRPRKTGGKEGFCYFSPKIRQRSISMS